MKEMPVAKPKSVKEKRRHSTASKSPYRGLSHILENYLDKYQNKEIHSKIDNELIRNFNQEKKKVDIDKEVYMKQRQSFMATKVNLQEIAMQDHLFTSMSNFYGLAMEKPQPLEQASSSILKNHPQVGPTTPNQSLCLSERKTSGEYGLLLPNVQKGQYKRYERYKKGGRSD